jgi:S-phase kinase-associated protein 1
MMQSAKIKLQTSDNEVFDVDKDIAERSHLIKQMIEDLGDSDAPIPLVNVSANVLKKVIQVRWQFERDSC